MIASTQTLNANGHKIGDTVELNSGGPLMTISVIRESEDYPGRAICECEWFSNDLYEAGNFFSESLKATP